jgi:hypothetical protein
VKGGARAVDALVPLGLLQARRGDPGAAATLQEATERAFATGEMQWIGSVAAARAEHAWLAGDDRRAAEEAASVFALAVQAAHPWFAGELAFWLQLAGAPAPVPAMVAEPHRLLLAGDWRAAADAWRALGWPYERALALACGDQNEPCSKRWLCWTAWEPGRRPSGSGASSAGAATGASPAAPSGPRRPTRPA